MNREAIVQALLALASRQQPQALQHINATPIRQQQPYQPMTPSVGVVRG